MLIERNLNGSYTISETIKGQLYTKTFYGYTRKEAVQRFKCFAANWAWCN